MRKIVCRRLIDLVVRMTAARQFGINNHPCEIKNQSQIFGANWESDHTSHQEKRKGKRASISIFPK